MDDAVDVFFLVFPLPFLVAVIHVEVNDAECQQEGNEEGGGDRPCSSLNEGGKRVVVRGVQDVAGEKSQCVDVLGRGGYFVYGTWVGVFNATRAVGEDELEGSCPRLSRIVVFFEIVGEIFQSPTFWITNVVISLSCNGLNIFLRIQFVNEEFLINEEF